MYKRLINPTEEEVGELLEEGYVLHSITPKLLAGFGRNIYGQDLIYHFTMEYVRYKNKAFFDELRQLGKN